MTAVQTPEVDLDQVAAATANAVVVDVREPGEYIQGHVPGAVLIPMGRLPSRMTELDRSRHRFTWSAPPGTAPAP